MSSVPTINVLGCGWLCNRDDWPPQKVLEATAEARAEVKATRELLHTAVKKNDQHKNDDGVFECRGRIQGQHPVYVSDSPVYAEKLLYTHAHKTTLHGGVGLTMAKVCERFWIPRLRHLAKKVIKRCAGCSKFRALAYEAPPPGNLPLTRTQGTSAYQGIRPYHAAAILA